MKTGRKKTNLQRVTRSKMTQSILKTALVMVAAMISACGAPFTSNEFFEENPNANYSGEAGIAGRENEAGGGSLGGSAVQSSAGAFGFAGSGGLSSSGGSATTASGGTATGMVESRECLKDWNQRECGDPCSHAPAAYAECTQVLNCLSEKNIKPPQGSLDPCYPAEYTALSLAIRVYDACCQ